MKNIPLYQRIFEYYYEKIMSGELKEGDQLPTDKEITEQFYVSRITAQSAVQMLVDRGIVERFRGKGTFVKKRPKETKLEKQTKLIGVIMCDFDNSFGLDLFKGIEEEAMAQDIHILFRRSHENIDLENKAIHSMVDLGVMGIIIQMAHGETYSEDILKLHLNGLPFVLIDRHMEKTKIPFVTTNNKESTAKMMRFLIKNGYKNIAFISASTEQTSTLNNRYEGYLSEYKTTKEYALLDLITPEIRERDLTSINYDKKLIKDYLLKHPEIDCVFAAEHYVAILVKDVLTDLGKKIPDDIGVVCFDSDHLENEEPFFTHIQQKQREMGHLAVRKMVAMNNNGQEYNTGDYVVGEIKLGKSIKLKGE